VFANSRDVAAFFGKRHDNAMQSITRLITQEAQLGLLDFQETPYVEAFNAQTCQSHDLDRDGVTLMAKGVVSDRSRMRPCEPEA